MVHGISVIVFGSLGLCSRKDEVCTTGAEAPADLDKPTCTPSSKIAHDKVLSIHQRREEARKP